MVLRDWSAARACLASVALLFASRLAAQSADTTSFVTTDGKDTVSIEQYTRTGNTITGAWIQHQGGVFVHDYALVLGNDGWPAHYVMTLYTSRPHTFLMSITYGSDSATRILVRDSVAGTERVVAQKAYPAIALSVLGMELALVRAHSAHTDSSNILLDRAEQRGPAQPLAVRFFGADSVRIGAAMWARLDRNGRLLAVRNGPQETRRVRSLDVAKLVAGFIAADAAAEAARVEIALPPDALQRFVGEYALTPTVSLVITLDGNKLMGRVGTQPAFQLFAQSPTTFFLRAAPATVEFDTDAAGAVTGLTVVQGGARRRATKTK